ncbi:uncharacterized protein LOC116417402 [Nasonia vitripennis]|uniref:Uncharacterized protein n=1 Tax=Nasonia vitripennis TaxID=7425 RepID=A0A7M7QIC2_NASVI|nr:uncharacterized protein LOC116417402 [Nasonia vitripennis]
MVRQVMGRIHSEASGVLRNVVFPVLREDNITKCIRYDKLIILYGNKLCTKYKPQYQHDMIRNRLRTLGRFLTRYYDDCVKAIYAVANYDKRGVFNSSYTSFQLGTLLKQVALTLRSQLIKENKLKQKKIVDYFLELREDNIAYDVNKTVEESQILRKCTQSEDVLPSVEEIRRVALHIQGVRNESLAALKES